MSQDVVKPDEAMEPGEWIRAQKARLAEKAVGEKQRVNEKERAAEAEKRKLVRAFAPIAKYMTEVAAAGVSLKSYGAGHKLEYTKLQPLGKDATDYQVRWEMWVPSGADDYTTEEWGFGVRAAMRGDKVGFENYDFGRKGNLKETWPLVAMAQEALKTFMDKVEMYTVHIEVPEV